jgi:integrase
VKKTTERHVVQGVGWSVWRTKQKTWKAYAKVADRAYTLHRSTRQLAITAAEEQTRQLLGYDPANRWGSLEAWQQWRAACAILERCGASVMQAAEFYEANYRTLKPVPVGEAVAAYLQKKAAVHDTAQPMLRAKAAWRLKKDGAVLSKWNYIVERTFESFKRFTAARGMGTTTQINISGVEEWLRQWRGKTRNDKLGMIRSFFKFCQARGMLREAETLTADIERSATADGEVTVLSPARLRELWRLPLTAGARRYLAVAAWTGARRSEILRLTWADVRFGEDCIVLAAHKTKTASRRLAPLLPPLKKFLAAIPGRDGALVPGDSADALTDAGRAALNGWPRNVLRHSWISYRLAETGDVDRVALEAGTSRQKVFSNYRAVETIDGHPVTKALAEEWFSLISS